MQDNREQYLKNMGVAGGADGYEISDRDPSALKHLWFYARVIVSRRSTVRPLG